MILFRIISNLIRLALNLLWLPLRIFSRNLFGIILLVGIIAFFVMLNNDKSVEQRDIAIPAHTVQGHTSVDAIRVPPAPPLPATNAPPINVQPVRKIENGNSSFAQDLLKLMSDDERAYYSQIFYWTMNNVAAGQTQQWANANTFGSLKPGDIFLNSRGHACRNFTEELKAGDIKQDIRGLACQRGGGAWCKLGPNSTPVCGLGQANSFWRDLKRSIGL